MGKLLFLSSKLLCCETPFDAEVNALEWAFDYAQTCGWSNILWETDAQEVWKEVLATKNPSGWFSFHNILTIRSRFCCNSGWKLNWRNRSSDGVVDSIAKISLSHSCILIVDEFSTRDLFNEIIRKLVLEQSEAAM